MNAQLLRTTFGRAGLIGAGSLLCAAGLMACSGGNTDGGSANDGPGSPFISDGGSGATLDIELRRSELGVGDTAGFFVRLRDPQGNPIPWIRVFCETERGVAILEPSAGGVAFESTGSDGNMSGVIGGVSPGSFIMECRAQQGFNLYDRVQVKVTGDVPVGFEGFPGAAGGNLGGGVLVDQTPEVEGTTGLRVTGIRFQDAGGSTSIGPLDLDQGMCAAEAEPFTYTSYAVTLKNDSNETVFVRTVQFTIRDSGAPSQTSRQTNTLELAPGQTGTVNGILNTITGCGGPYSAGCYSGTSTPIEGGTHNATVVLTGVTANDDSFSISGNFIIQWDQVNNCAA